MKTGICNLGATCYLNTALQSLLSCTKFVDFVLSIDSKQDLFNSFKSITQLVCNSQGTVLVMPIKFIKCVQSHMNDKINLYQQNDLQEFILLFLDELNKTVCVQLKDSLIDQQKENLSRLQLCKQLDKDKPRLRVENLRAELKLNWYLTHKREMSYIIELFGGQQMNQVKCQSCGYITHNFECFNSLPLCFYGTQTSFNINELLGHYCQTEIITEWQCDKCKCHRAEKVCKLYNLPKYLILFIKRFDANLNKINHAINIEETIDIADLCLFEHTLKYNLVSVGYHYGAYSSGHYFAVCKDKGQWIKYDDDEIKQLETLNLDSSSLHCSYVMIYESQ